jgi:hypothetical protein
LSTTFLHQLLNEVDAVSRVHVHIGNDQIRTGRIGGTRAPSDDVQWAQTGFRESEGLISPPIKQVPQSKANESVVIKDHRAASHGSPSQAPAKVIEYTVAQPLRL